MGGTFSAINGGLAGRTAPLGGAYLLEKLEGFEIFFKMVPHQAEQKEAALLPALGMKPETPEPAKGKVLCLTEQQEGPRGKRLDVSLPAMLRTEKTALGNGEKPTLTSTQLLAAAKAGLEVGGIATEG